MNYYCSTFAAYRVHLCGSTITVMNYWCYILITELLTLRVIRSLLFEVAGLLKPLGKKKSKVTKSDLQKEFIFEKYKISTTILHVL